MRQGYKEDTFTLADGQALSEVIALGDAEFLALNFATGVEGTNYGFVGSATKDGTYVDIYKDGTIISRAINLDVWDAVSADMVALAPFNFIKVKSDTNQTGAGTVAAIWKD
jgi:hypothetical protein